MYKRQSVDKAESMPEVCAEVNGMGTLNMVRAALAVQAKLMYISTDYVFEGSGDQAYEVNDPIMPQSVYGLTKAQGEEAVLSLMQRYYIVRISWVFGENGHNFVRTMLRLGAEKKELTVVNDQIGSPTYTADLAVLPVSYTHLAMPRTARLSRNSPEASEGPQPLRLPFVSAGSAGGAGG